MMISGANGNKYHMVEQEENDFEMSINDKYR